MQRLYSNYYDFFRVLSISSGMPHGSAEYMWRMRTKKRGRNTDPRFVNLLKEKIEIKERKLRELECEA